MRTTNIAKKLKQISIDHKASLESQAIDPPPKPVEQQPTDLPYAKEQDHSDETGVTMDVVEPTELYEELDAAIADIALDITAIENLTIVSNLSSQNLNNSAMEEFVKSTVGLESATRLLTSTTTGGIQCSADIISLEEIAGNAAKAGWDNIYRKVGGILSKAESIATTTEENGKRIQDQFRAVKKAAFDYKGGSVVNIGIMSNGDADLNRAIANTKLAILEDLGGKASGSLDKAINDLTKQATTILTTKKGDIATIVASGIKTADSLASAYKIKDAEFPILGFARKSLDDQLTLPQGIIGSLSGSGRVYNFPRYSPIKQAKKIEVDLKPNTVKDLYSIGMNIGNEIADQARLWPQRLEALKSIAELAKSQGSNVDADRNTWSAEQMAAKNTLKMWNANASARKHYINVYNKIATEVLEVLNHVSGGTKEPSQELFGLGKPKALPIEQAASFVKSKLSKFNGGVIEANVSLLGNANNAVDIIKFVDDVISKSNKLVDLARIPFADVYKAIGVFEENDDEDAMDDVINVSMAPLVKFLSKPFILNGYEGRAVRFRNNNTGLEGEFNKLEDKSVSIDLDQKALAALIAKSDALAAAKQHVNKLPWLDYAQEYCDWIYPLTQMLDATREQLLSIGLKAVGSKDTISTEVFGGFFSKKPKEVPQATIPVHKPDLKALIKSTAFPGFKENYVADIIAYNDDFKQHLAAMSKACNEIGKSFNTSNVNKYVDDVKKLLDLAYAQAQQEMPDENDWRHFGNHVLDIFGPELVKSNLLTKHFGMQGNKGVFTTNFDYAPNYMINRTSTENLENKRLVKRLVSGFTKDTALSFFTVMDSIDEIDLPKGLDSCDFLRAHPRFEDSVYIIAIEPLFGVTSRLFEIMDLTYFAIRDGLNT